MDTDRKDDMYETQTINNLKTRLEITRQQMREIQFKLDSQIDIFTRIHGYSQQAFHVDSEELLYEIITGGIVDVFEMEIGAIFKLSSSRDNLALVGSCNLENYSEDFTITPKRDWMENHELWSFKNQKTYVESDISDDSLWKSLDLAHCMYTPIFDNDKKFCGVILGGITRIGNSFYDFSPNEILSPFTLYSQQMNGIYNNMHAIRAAVDAGNAKGQFLANLSHEIRTPMNAIIGMVQIAQRTDEQSEMRRCISKISSSSTHLLGLINDVLDISKIEEGKLSLSNDSFDVDEALDTILTSVKAMADLKQIKLDVCVNRNYEGNLIGDSMRLTQVLLNLISNAIKFTPELGTVSLYVEEQSRSENKILMKFRVTDTGIGISKEAQQRIYSPFEQADNSVSRKFGGTGLGLTISQRIVELMGSSIKIRSEIGQGSSFSFSVWFEVGGLSEDRQKQDELDSTLLDFSTRRILLVDDIEINREIIVALLDDTGIQIDQACNGREAVDKFSASRKGYYDLILMDVQMPELDGCSATTEIRNLNHIDAQSVIILAMTANVFKEDVRKVTEAGMDGHIPKPVEYDILIRSLRDGFISKDKRETHRMM